MFSAEANTLFDPALRDPEPVDPSRLSPMRMAPENPEEVVKDAILLALEGKYDGLLNWLRPKMISLYLQREKHQGRELAFVTADDARVILDTTPGISKDMNRNFMGAIFKNDKRFKPTGQFYKSTTPGSRANRLMCWRYVGS